jgi:putative membrane protein
MNELIAASLAGIGPHVVYFMLSLVIAALFVAIYVHVTPYPELALIREGNTAAAVCLGGALVGFALPLAKAVAQSASVLDMLIWSAVAFVSQLIAFFIVRLVLKDLSGDIRNGKLAAAIFLASVAIAIGLLNSAAMTL